MKIEATNFLSPVGRLVQGHPMIGRTEDSQGRALVTRKGDPKTVHFLGVAFKKSDPNWSDFHKVIVGVAKSGFPKLFRGDECLKKDFSWKITDGDSTEVDGAGISPSDKPGFKGCWVVSFSSSFAPKVVRTDQTTITDPEQLKRGYYVRVAGTLAPNGLSDKPGIYINPFAVQLVAYGQEIKSGFDHTSAFAAPLPDLPEGASVSPIAPDEPLPFVESALQQGLPEPPQDGPKYAYKGKLYTRGELESAGWTSANIESLPVG